MRRAIAPLAVLALAASAPAAAAEEVTSTMPGRYFSPASVTIVPGDSVRWRNLDFVEHTVAGPDGLFDSGRLGRNASFAFRFESTGSYQIICTLHTFMRQTVDVAPALLDAPPGAVSPGQTVSLRGRVAAGTTLVRIERESAPGVWSVVATAVPAADGTFSVPVSPTATASYRAAVAAGAGSAVTVSATSRVRVDVRVRRGERRTAVAVRATPVLAGAVAVLETYNRERYAWRRAGRARLGENGRARFRVAAGLRRVGRVIVRSATGDQAGRSDRFKLHPKARGPARVIRPGGSQGGTTGPGTGDTPDAGGENAGH